MAMAEAAAAVEAAAKAEQETAAAEAAPAEAQAAEEVEAQGLGAESDKMPDKMPQLPETPNSTQWKEIDELLLLRDPNSAIKKVTSMMTES